MSMFDQFGTDTNLEKEGVWTEYGDYRIKIAHLGGANTAFSKRTEAVFKPYARQLADKSIDRNLLNRLSMQVAAETIVRGWQVQDTDKNGEPKVDKDGEPVWKDGIHTMNEDGTIGVMPFTVENVLKTFKLLPHLYDDVQSVAGEINAYKTRIREDIAGN